MGRPGEPFGGLYGGPYGGPVSPLKGNDGEDVLLQGTRQEPFLEKGTERIMGLAAESNKKGIAAV